MSFHKDLSETCKEARVAVDDTMKLIEHFVSRNMSKLSRQELDLLNRIISNFEKIEDDFYKLSVFAKYAEEV